MLKQQQHHTTKQKVASETKNVCVALFMFSILARAMLRVERIVWNKDENREVFFSPFQTFYRECFCTGSRALSPLCRMSMCMALIWCNYYLFKYFVNCGDYVCIPIRIKVFFFRSCDSRAHIYPFAAPLRTRGHFFPRNVYYSIFLSPDFREPDFFRFASAIFILVCQSCDFSMMYNGCRSPMYTMYCTQCDCVPSIRTTIYITQFFVLIFILSLYVYLLHRHLALILNGNSCRNKLIEINSANEETDDVGVLTHKTTKKTKMSSFKQNNTQHSNRRKKHLAIFPLLA